MAKIKFVTVKGSSTLSTDPFYVGLVQHERSMSRNETYNHLADKIGYNATAIRAVFMALKEYCRENARKGNITYLDNVASIRNIVKGGFETLSGPWTKGVNYLAVSAQMLDTFKSALSGITPENMTYGVSPRINTVYDEVAKVYDVITGTNLFSVAGENLGPDTSKTDEFVSLVSAAGVETQCTVTYSDLGNVKAKLATALAAGEYTLKVATRCGLGGDIGVKVATRKVTVC